MMPPPRSSRSATANLLPTVELFGKQATLPAAGADPLAWLTGFVGATTASAPADSNWLTLHGDPSRNIQSPGGEPHLRPRWEARVVNEPAIESFLTSRTNDFVQRGVVAIPGAGRLPSAMSL